MAISQALVPTAVDSPTRLIIHSHTMIVSRFLEFTECLLKRGFFFSRYSSDIDFLLLFDIRGHLLPLGGERMLKKLFAPSEVFARFIIGLHLSLSKPQMNHVSRVGEAIIVSEGKKTLSALYSECVDAPDVSAVADFFRQSPWSGQEMREGLMRFVIGYLLQGAEEQGYEPVVTVILDDSTTRKDKDTKRLQGVDWVFDHAASGKGQTKYCKAGVHVNLRIQIGAYGFTFSWRIYLKKSTVRRLNRNRSEADQIAFRSKNSLAREMLVELRSYLPSRYEVYVLFDRWYSSTKLIRYIRRQGWHVIAAVKSNRQVDGISMKTLTQRLRHKRYTRVRCVAADGSEKTYLARKVEGYISGYPEKVCVIISKRHNRDRHPKYFLCTDTSLSAQGILKWYGKRWSIEVEYWYLKQCLGLGDFRLQSYEAMQRWYAVVYLVLTFLQWQLYQSQKSGAPCSSIAEVIRRHREKHALQLLERVCEEAIRTNSVSQAIQRFIGSAKKPVSQPEPDSSRAA